MFSVNLNKYSHIYDLFVVFIPRLENFNTTSTFFERNCSKNCSVNNRTKSFKILGNWTMSKRRGDRNLTLGISDSVTGSIVGQYFTKKTSKATVGEW